MVALPLTLSSTLPPLCERDIDNENDTERVCVWGETRQERKGEREDKREEARAKEAKEEREKRCNTNKWRGRGCVEGERMGMSIDA